MIYIMGLSYVNLRILNRRTTKISICHCFYFVGFLLVMLELGPTPHSNSMGLWLIICSCTIISLIIINELLHSMKMYNYKCSMDEALNESNYNKELYLNRNDLIVSFKQRKPIDCSIFVGNKIPYDKQFLLLPILKLKGCMLFSVTLLYVYGMYGTIELFNNTNLVYVPQCFILFGSIIGLIITLKLNYKKLFLLANLTQIMLLIISILVYHVNETFNGLPLLIYFSAASLSYSLSDICILKLTNLKFTELMLSIGYFIEILPIAIFQYFNIYKNEFILISDAFYNYLAYTSSFIFVTILLILIVILTVQYKPEESLLDIQYNNYDIVYYNHRNTMSLSSDVKPTRYHLIHNNSSADRQGNNELYDFNKISYRIPRPHLIEESTYF